MQVQLDKRYDIACPPEQAWAVLKDIRAVAGCMPGAQITEEIDATHYKGTVKSKVGPAVMSFAGDIEVKALDAATRRMEMLGKGADKGGSSASMNLAAQIEPGADAGSSVLAGTATVTVSGKLAQFGGRLIMPVADAMLAQFADNFRAAAAAAAPPAAVPVAAAQRTVGASEPAGPESAAAAAAAAATPVAPVAPAPVRELNVLSLLWAVVKGWFRGRSA